MDRLDMALFERQLREADLEALEVFRSGKGEAPVIYKSGFVTDRAPGEPGTVFVASEESADRMGDIIEVAGWELENFQRNPVLMFAHDYRVAPIGTVPKVWVLKGLKQLLNTVSFDEADPLAAFIKGKYDRGVMRAESVGFRALEFELQEDVKGILGMPALRFTKQELIEISAVPVPAHPAALRKMMGSGKFTIVMPEVVIPETLSAEADESSGTIEEIRELANEISEMTAADDDAFADLVANRVIERIEEMGLGLSDETNVLAEEPETPAPQNEDVDDTTARMQGAINDLRLAVEGE